MAQDLKKELALKLKLENTLRLELRRLFNIILRDYGTKILAGIEFFSANTYRPAFQSMLYNHYERVQKAFIGLVRNDMGRVKSLMLKQERTAADELDILRIVLLTWRDRNAPIAAEQLTNTTTQNMIDAYNMARQSFVEEGVFPEASELSRTAAVDLRRKLYGREETIVSTETQTPAEHTKFAEASVLAGFSADEIIGGLAITAAVKKLWRTVLDTKVRDNHKLANGQVRNLTEPFLVGGELLMFPGDRSMGASIGNIANCRCSSVYAATS